MNTVTDSTRSLSPIYSDVDMAALDICCAAKFAIIVAGSITMLRPADGGHTLTTHKHGDIAEMLASVPRGAMLRVSFQAATPRSSDAIIKALTGAGFQLSAVARHEDTLIGRPGKEKTMRDGMLAFKAPMSIDDEIKEFANNVVAVMCAPLL